MPEANHTFLPGHWITVQVQSRWFPLYDRNPQTFVPNIAMAQPADFSKATQQVWFSPGRRVTCICRWSAQDPEEPTGPCGVPDTHAGRQLTPAAPVVAYTRHPFFHPGRHMAKPNYSFEKRQREIAKKKKQDEKDAKKRAEREADKPTVAPDAPLDPDAPG